MPTALNARKPERVAYLPVENNASARIAGGLLPLGHLREAFVLSLFVVLSAELVSTLLS
jgi:hypothetical protein